jgi:predicted NBD/HSP70 family sugar kinase
MQIPRLARGGHRSGGDVGGGNAGHLRRQNLERVLAVAMDQAVPFTRAELIKATGLSAPTVGSLVSHLGRIGLIRDLGTGPSRGGRRPASMEFNARHGFAAGIDLGPTKTRLAVADLRGERLAHRVIPTPSGVGPTVLLTRLAAALRGLLREAKVPSDRLLAVGAGAPGAVDWRRGTVVALASNLEGWSNVPMAEILRKALDAPVLVENDVNLAVLGERWRGAARGHETCAFITIGTGIGAGVVVDGALHRGHHFLAGEIAYMCMGAEYVDQHFPGGCLETLAGLKALAARWRRGAGTDPGRDVTELFEAAHNGDREARSAVREVAALVSIATANLSLALDPSLIVLGGALVAHQPLVDEVRRIVGQILPTPTELVVSTLGTDAPLWGALLLATNEARERLRQSVRDVRVPAREVSA